MYVIEVCIFSVKCHCVMDLIISPPKIFVGECIGGDLILN